MYVHTSWLPDVSWNIESLTMLWQVLRDPYCWCSITLHSLLKIVLKHTTTQLNKAMLNDVASEPWPIMTINQVPLQMSFLSKMLRFLPWRQLASCKLDTACRAPSAFDDGEANLYRKPFRSYSFLDPLFVGIIAYRTRGAFMTLLTPTRNHRAACRYCNGGPAMLRPLHLGAACNKQVTR